MSLLPGRFIDKEVAKQIEKRQEVIGASKRLPLFDEEDPRSYQFFLSKTPFIRLTSGIDKEGLTSPASQAVLDNAFASRRGDVSSIVPGYEFSDDYGVRPAAGIVGMTLKTHNRYGSLRTATVQFEVHSLEQMNLYEEMFMRPGYSALLEWGHTVWLDSDTGEVNDLPQLLSDSFINKSLVTEILKSDSSTKDVGNENKQAIYLAIEEMRRRTNYNYDGMYGLIKNFSWSLRPDGGFSCTVDIVSIGTVVESLTINAGITDEEVVQYFNEREIEFDEVKAVEENEGKSFWEIVLIGLGITKGTKDENLSAAEKAFKLGLEELVKTSKFEVDLKTSLTKNDRKILYSIDLDTFTFLMRGIWQNSSMASFQQDPDLDAPALFNNKTFSVTFTGDDGNPIVEDFEVTLESATRITKTTESTSTYGGSVTTTYYNYDYLFRFNPIGSSNSTTADTDETDDNASAQGTVADLIKSFNREFNSRIHLTLHLLREYLKEGIAPTMMGGDAVEVYQEIKFEPKLDVPDTDPKYRKEDFPKLAPQLESHYKTGAVRRTLGEGTTDDFHYYIQLGTFLDILNLYIPSTNQNGEFLFQYHTDKNSPHIYKTLEKYHASVDITKCILPDSYGIQGYTGRGDILGIFIEIEYLFGLIEKGLVNGDLKGYDVVTEILRDVNISVGQINELALQYHEESFTFHIVDRKLVGEEAKEEVALDLIGRNTILRNVTMNSKLSPGISTQIAISAQANPEDNGISGTLFARFNKNLKDRYIPEKKTNLDRLAAQEEEKEKEKLDKLALVFNYLRFVYGGNAFKTQQVAIPGVINEYRLLTSTLLGKEGKSRSYGGILPFELGLEIEGISGMQVMDSFVINQNILPKSYVGDGNFGFLITGLTHKVDTNGWVTEVRSQIYNRPSSLTRNAAIGSLQLDGDEERDFKLVKIEHTPWTGKTPQAERVRKWNEYYGGTVKDLSHKYDNYMYDELSSGADIQKFLADTTITFLTRFRGKYGAKYNVRITGGNDVWHHNHAPSSQHTKGRGLDFTIREGDKALGESDEEIKILKDMSNWIDEYFRGNTDVYYKDEYNETRQSNHATGNHFHFHVLKDN